MKKITFLIIVIGSFFISNGQTNSFPYLYVGSSNPISISDGLIQPQLNTDDKSLEIHATKFNVGKANSQTYDNNNTAVLNCAGMWDGTEMVRFRAYYNTSYFNMYQVFNGKIQSSFVQEGQPQLFLSANPNNSIGIATSAPNINAKLDVNGNIFSNGKIAIGTTDMAKIGTNALTVNGSAIFTKATVALYAAWPDYVFSSTYKMPSLDSLEQFIQQNKHLPEIPTASDVEKNGIDLGNNQVLLLKKIEELTLIVIEQNKSIQDLKKVIQKIVSNEQNLNK